MTITRRTAAAIAAALLAAALAACTDADGDGVEDRCENDPNAEGCDRSLVVG